MKPDPHPIFLQIKSPCPVVLTACWVTDLRHPKDSVRPTRLNRKARQCKGSRHRQPWVTSQKGRGVKSWQDVGVSGGVGAVYGEESEDSGGAITS